MGSLPWGMIGAIIGGLSFLLTLLVEWNKLGTWRRIIIALVVGAFVFFIVNLVAPLVFPPPGSTATTTAPANTTESPATSTLSVPTSTSLQTKTDVTTNAFTPIPTLVPTLGVNAFTASGTTDWFLTFDYSFPAGFWHIGTHKYTLTASCPNEATGSITHDFTVSDNFRLLPGDVYLRWGGLKRSKLYGVDPTLLEGINPLQSTTAVVTWDLITQNEAEWRSTNCTGTINWDDGSSKLLVAQVPSQH